MKRLMKLAMVVAAGCALTASAQIAPLDKAREAAARDTAASRGTPEQQHAINMQDSKPAPPPSQAVTGTVMSPSKGGAAKASPAKTSASAKATPAKGRVPTPEEIKKLAAEEEKKSAGKPAPEMAKKSDSRRDPFVSPIVQVSAGGPTPTCTGGKHCLAASDLALRGIVKSQNGWIAVVENGAHRTYFLHEKDELFNAIVEKITKDSMVIREQTYDNLGKPVPHEVVKKLPA